MNKYYEIYFAKSGQHKLSIIYPVKYIEQAIEQAMSFIKNNKHNLYMTRCVEKYYS